MGKFNYLQMILRVKIMFFIRDGFIGKIFYRRNTSRSIPTQLKISKTGNIREQSQNSAEYRIYVHNEHITHFLN
ncbi:MAG: hypothetical protein ABIN89_01520 [Chitinophagaceae bacterium]